MPRLGQAARSAKLAAQTDRAMKNLHKAEKKYEKCKETFAKQEAKYDHTLAMLEAGKLRKTRVSKAPKKPKRNKPVDRGKGSEYQKIKMAKIREKRGPRGQISEATREKLRKKKGPMTAEHKAKIAAGVRRARAAKKII